MGTKSAKLFYLIPTLALAGILLAALHNVAMANPAGHDWHMGADPEQRQELAKMRLQRMENRLEIKSSQLKTWEQYADAVGALAEPPAGKAESRDDAAAVSHDSADRAAKFAQKLARVADATDKLQAVLNEDQRKIFSEMVRHPQHKWMRHKLESHCEHEHEQDGRDGMYREMHREGEDEGMGGQR